LASYFFVINPIPCERNLPSQHFTEYLLPLGQRQPLLLFLGDDLETVGSSFGFGMVTNFGFILLI
jgi:hypothetical protein